MDILKHDDSLNFLEKIEKEISLCNTFSELSELVNININDLSKIVKTDDIKLELPISRYQKHLFLTYFSNFYTTYFIVKIPKTDKKKQRINRRSSKKLTTNSLEAKQKTLCKLEEGFDVNYIGLFEELRISRIEKLKEEIDFLITIRKSKNKNKSNYKKPYARIIYTPMGGKIK